MLLISQAAERMHNRGNGKGGGVAVAGCFPKHPDHFALHVALLDPETRGEVEREYVGSILEEHLLARILAEFEVDAVYHLAAVLSTRAEFAPVTGHQVNVEGTLNMVRLAARHAAPEEIEVLRRELIDRHAVSPAFADKLIEGLLKAGLEES